MTLDSVSKVQAQVARVADKAVEAKKVYTEVIGEHKKGVEELAQQIVDLQDKLVKKNKECEDLKATHEAKIKTLTDSHVIAIKFFLEEHSKLAESAAKMDLFLVNFPLYFEMQLEQRTLNFESNLSSFYNGSWGTISSKITYLKEKIDPSFIESNIYACEAARVHVSHMQTRLKALNEMAKKV